MHFCIVLASSASNVTELYAPGQCAAWMTPIPPAAAQYTLSLRPGERWSPNAVDSAVEAKRHCRFVQGDQLRAVVDRLLGHRHVRLALRLDLGTVALVVVRHDLLERDEPLSRQDASVLSEM
jgi:hypothetical protein